MRTLDNWAHRLLELPLLIECPSMQVLAFDGEKPLFTGPGHISIKSADQMEFMMHGHPHEVGLAFERLNHARDNPYSQLAQLQVNAVDYDGVEWSCGRADIQIGEVSQGVWHLSGSIQGIDTRDDQPGVRPEAGMELIYEQRLDVPIPLVTRGKLREAGSSSFEFSEGRVTHHEIVEVEGGKVIFHKSHVGQRFWVTASGFHSCQHQLIEKWISEPFNILLGQVAYPRLVAWNLGDGSAQISLRKVSELPANRRVSSILFERGHPLRFWKLYGQILTMFVRTHDRVGQYEHHPLTRYYQEIAQASLGSNWVQCMTLASVIEGVTKMMPRDEEPEAEGAEDDWGKSIVSLKAHIEAWDGDKVLREKLMNSLRLAREKGVIQLLKSQRDAGVINKEHLDVWLSVRNSVMHGKMVSPWLTEDLEKKLRLLVEMVHRVSEVYICKCIDMTTHS